MPSRRTLLTTLAAVTAGCMTGPGTTPDSQRPNAGSSPSATDETVVGFDEVDLGEVPERDPVLVVSPEWRRWVRRAASGGTVRAAVNDPEFCGRAQLDDNTTVELRDAGKQSGTYETAMETGGHYRYPFRAEQATPREDAPVHDLREVPDVVASHLRSILESGSGTIEPQTRTYEFVESHTLGHEDYRYLLYVRWDGTTYRVSARIPTYTPACGFYVVFELSDAGGERPDTTLSLAGGDELGAVDEFGGDSRPLSVFSEGTRPLLREFEYVLTVTRCYRVVLFE